MIDVLDKLFAPVRQWPCAGRRAYLLTLPVSAPVLLLVPLGTTYAGMPRK